MSYFLFQKPQVSTVSYSEVGVCINYCLSGLSVFFIEGGAPGLLNQLSSEQIAWAKTKCVTPSSLSGNDDFDKYAKYIMQINDKN